MREVTSLMGRGGTMVSKPSKVRHDVRNLLNAIKLTSAVLIRRHRADEMTRDSLRAIDQAADEINELVTRFTQALEGDSLGLDDVDPAELSRAIAAAKLSAES